MTLFFILLIALVVYQFSTRKKLAQTYRQFDRNQIKRISNAPFYLTSWALLFIFVAYALSALTGMIGELFNVDNYISLFGGGWLGLILQFLRSSGFIGDIQEPIVLMQYRGTISTICSVLLFSGIICIFSLIAYFKELKKPRLNKAAILTYYYLSMACGLTSYILIIWGLYGFNDLMNHGVKFHMEEIYIYLSLFFVASCGFTLIKGAIELKKVFDLPQCENLTWQQLLAKIKINTDKGKRPITEGQIVGIALGLSFLVSSCVILSTLPVSEETEDEPTMYQPTVSEPTNTSEAEIVAPSVEDEEYCINLVTQLFTSSYDILDANGGIGFYETSRFIEYSKCMENPLVDLGFEYSIGDGLVKISKIEKMDGDDNRYMVQYYADYWHEEVKSNSVIVVMNKEEGKWKVDNAYHKIEEDGQYHILIDYSRPASDYYTYPDCEKEYLGGLSDDGEIMVDDVEENENFISL